MQAEPLSQQRQLPVPKAIPRLAPEQPGRWRQVADLLWLAGVVFRAAPQPSAQWAAVTVARGLLVPAQLWLTKTMVDALAAQVAGTGGQGAAWWLALLAVTLLAERALSGTEPYLQARARERAGPALQEQVMRKASGLELAAFEHQSFYDQLNRVMSQAERRGPELLDQMLQMISAVPMLLGYVVALALLTPVLLLIAAGAATAAVVGWVLSGQSYWSVLSQKTREHRLAEYHASVLTGREFAKEVRLYGLADYLLGRWEALFWQTQNHRRSQALRQGLRQRGIVLLADGAIIFGLVWVVAAGLSQGATPGQYALLFQSIHGLISRIFGLSQTLQALGEQSGYASDFRAFMRLQAEPGTAPHPFPLPLAESIRFEDVWFTYPGSDRPALAGVTLTIRAGEKVALVGENGAGKTTLIKLLLGLYRPDSGRITFDGRDIAEIDPHTLRRAMSSVFQQFVHYQLSFGENVGLGQPEHLGDRTRLDQAVARAGADEVLQGLPLGYETILGPDVGGVDLSGGQWQRIAIARGFFREAQVLVLDEPTAALDPLAELAVFERFAEMARGRTAVLISHRLGMARLADRVLVLTDGRLIEQGPHDALVRTGGTYADMFRAQARWYE